MQGQFQLWINLCITWTTVWLAVKMKKKVCSLVSFSHLMLSFRWILFCQKCFWKLLQPCQSFIARSNCFCPCSPGWSYTASKPSQRIHFLLKQEATCLLHSNYIEYLKKNMNKYFSKIKEKRQIKETATLAVPCICVIYK